METKQENHSRGFMRDSLWSGATLGITLAFQMAEIMILSRALPQEVLGAFFLVIAFPELIQGLLDFRLQEVMIKYLINFIGIGDVRQANALIKITWIISAGAGLAIVLIVAAIAPFTAALVGKAADASLMIFYAFGLFLGSLQGRSGAILRALGRFDVILWISAAIALIRFGLLLTAVLLSMGLPGLIGSRVVTNCISSIIIGIASFLLLRRRIPIDLSVPISVLRPLWKELGHFSFHLNLSSIGKALAQKLDTILVGALLTPTAVAAYKVVGQLGKAMYLVSDPLMTAAYPRFVKLASNGDLHELNRLAFRSSVMLAGLIAPVLLLFIFFHKSLVVLFAGPQYASFSWLLPIFLCSSAAGIILFWTHPYLLSVGLPQFSSLANIVGRTAGVVFFGALVAFSSLQGAAIGSGLPACFTVAIGLWSIWQFNQRKHPVVLGAVPKLPESVTCADKAG